MKVAQRKTVQGDREGEEQGVEVRWRKRWWRGEEAISQEEGADC